MKAAALSLLALGMALVAGCGVKGAPQPPSLHLPQPPLDLRAARKADRVVLYWSAPRQTTDRESIRRPGATRICRALSPDLQPPAMTECAQIVATVPPPAAAAAAPANPEAALPMSYSEALPAELEQAHPAGAVEYTVEALNPRGRAAGLSNPVVVPLAPTLAPPVNLRAQVEADGIHLSATAAAPQNPAAENPALRFSYRVYRASLPAAPKAAPALVSEIPATATLAVTDQSFAWEAKYAYSVTPVTTVLSPAGTAAAAVEGQDSAAVEVFAHDIYPPAPPTGLQAVFSGLPQQLYIDLSWNQNTEADLAGYYVYRRQAGAAAHRISETLLKTPTFRDTQVQPGHTYFYSVSAVDLRSNESAKSAETSEQVPASF